jgi:hypothetical protein
MFNRYYKYLILLLCLPVLCGAGYIINPYGSFGSGGSPPSYLLDETLEGTGYADGTWTEYREESQGTIDEDYTTTVLSGSQSLYIQSITYRLASTDSKSVTTSGTAGVYFIWQPKVSSTNTYDLIILEDSSNNEVGRLRVSSSDQLQMFHGSSSHAVQTVSISTTYHIWMDYTPGTGANSSLLVYVATSSTKPGTATDSLTNENETTTVDHVVLACQYAGEGIFDNIRISDDFIN